MSTAEEIRRDMDQLLYRVSYLLDYLGTSQESSWRTDAILNSGIQLDKINVLFSKISASLLLEDVSSWADAIMDMPTTMNLLLRLLHNRVAKVNSDLLHILSVDDPRDHTAVIRGLRWDIEHISKLYSSVRDHLAHQEAEGLE